MEKSKRVCLPISGACNSKCIFCMDDWTLSSFITIDDITSKLSSAREYSDEVTFSSLEPTLHPHLNEIVEIAKSMGFVRIEIVTNGRKLNKYEYAESLIQSGINEFDISIHSYNSLKHDIIVGSPGAFTEGINGLVNICKLSKLYPIKKTVSVTVCKQNYKDIYKIILFLEKFGLDNIILNILQPRNAAKINKDQTYVQYSYMVNEFLKLQPFQETYKNIYINGLVPCLSIKLKNIIGYFNGAQINNKNNDGDYFVEFNTFKEKRSDCNNCKYFALCDGVWQSYVEKFGWDEFIPVTK